MKDNGDLIPRKTLFGNPERTAVTISHDGTRVAWLAPVDGVLNVWVAPVDAIGEAKPVTRDGAGGSGTTCGAITPAACSTARTATGTRTGTSTPSRSRPAGRAT